MYPCTIMLSSTPSLHLPSQDASSWCCHKVTRCVLQPIPFVHPQKGVAGGQRVSFHQSPLSGTPLLVSSLSATDHTERYHAQFLLTDNPLAHPQWVFPMCQVAHTCVRRYIYSLTLELGIFHLPERQQLKLGIKIFIHHKFKHGVRVAKIHMIKWPKINKWPSPDAAWGKNIPSRGKSKRKSPEAKQEASRGLRTT